MKYKLQITNVNVDLFSKASAFAWWDNKKRNEMASSHVGLVIPLFQAALLSR